MESYFLILNNDKLDNLLPYYQFIDYEHMKKIERFRNDIDKKMSIYGELIARAVISKKETVLPQDIFWGVDDYGKPFIKNSFNINFSISHTQNAVLCAISRKGDIGADIEVIGPYFSGVMNYIGHTEELEVIKNIAKEKRTQVFYEIWTRKEAYGKKNGLGICQNLKKINTLESGNEKNFISWTVGHYMCSVCTNTKEVNRKYILTEEEIIAFFHSCL